LLDEIHNRWPAAGIAIITNGTALSEKIISKISLHRVDVQISLDGPDAERHDIIRGVGSYNKMMAGYSALKNAGINPIFQAVLSHRTSPWIADFFQTAAALKASAMSFTRFVPQGRGKSLQTLGDDRPLAGLELRDAYAAIIKASSVARIDTGTNKPLFVLISPELGAHGKSGFQGLVIDYQGNLKISSRTDFKLGNILESGLEELFLRHPVMNALRAGKIEGCGSCRFYDSCGGDRNASFVEYGSFLKKDPACWLQPQRPIYG
jgi:radical SAM protein with 4Fe4S-binding SPASM domain